MAFGDVEELVFRPCGRVRREAAGYAFTQQLRAQSFDVVRRLL